MAVFNNVQMDRRTDPSMDRIYEALVHWADAILIASPIPVGGCLLALFKMAEPTNCVAEPDYDQQ